MKWNPSNREWYISKGYPFTKWHDEFEVKIQDLTPYSQVILSFKCDYCGTEHKRKFQQYFKTYKDDTTGKHSCNECRTSRLEENKITSNANLLERINKNEHKKHLKIEIEKDVFIYIKSCKKCGKYKELDCFNKNMRSGVLEYQSICTECYTNHRELNKSKIRLYHVKESSLEMNLPVNISDKKLDKIIDRFQGKCALTNSVNTVFEHFIPVSWGHGGTYMGNVYLLQDSLNFSKSNQNPFEWIKRKEIKKEVDMKSWKKLINYLASRNNLSVDEFKEYVYWCERNKRTAEQVKKDGNISSKKLWRKATSK